MYVENLDPFVLDSEPGNGLTFWKELIYAGQFEKSEDDLKFSVDEASIDHWVKTHKLFMQRGIDVPLPLEHTFNPEDTRGLVVGMKKAKDSKGRIALFGKIEFRDKEAAKMTSTAKVSIFVPPEFSDEKGNEYLRPIRHVALTDYPVINSMDGFIAASHSGKEISMSMKSLAKAIGLEFDDEKDPDDKISAAIASKFKKLSEKLKLAEHDVGGDDGGTPTTKPPDVSASTKPTKAIITVLSENRQHKIDDLVTKNHITPATAKKLSTQYCEDKTLTLSLSDDAYSDGFDSVIEALRENDPVVLGEQTSGQSERRALELSDKDNPLIKDAERRAKEAKEA